MRWKGLTQELYLIDIRFEQLIQSTTVAKDSGCRGFSTHPLLLKPTPFLKKNSNPKRDCDFKSATWLQWQIKIMISWSWYISWYIMIMISWCIMIFVILHRHWQSGIQQGKSEIMIRITEIRNVAFKSATSWSWSWYHDHDIMIMISTPYLRP